MTKQKFAAIALTVSLIIFQSSCGPFTDRAERGEAKTAPHFKPGFNIFSPEQDIELGRESARKISRQAPLLKDQQTVAYVRRLGAKLAAKAPGHKFPYQFEVVAVREINAFALPGGFIYINAGAIAAARNEGELAGVIAHEISHVALRHGTNQASKAYLAQVGFDVLSTITGGEDTDLGKVINAIGGAGANVVFLKMSRSAETESDLEGARIMAEAGYDPRDMASFFKTLEAQEKQSGQQGPEFLNDHPDPGNRVESITRALPSLPVSSNPVHDSDDFERIKSRLTGLGAAKSLSRIGPAGSGGKAARPAPPSDTLAQYEARDGSFALQYPENWDGLEADESNVIFAPRGSYGRMNESVMVTHGIFIGAISVNTSNLEEATRLFVEQQLKANPDFKVSGETRAIAFGDRKGFATVVAGPSPVTGVVEIDVIYTTATDDGRLFYLVTIAPQDEFLEYKPAFEKIISAIRLKT
jgi:hypothetical protein